MRVFVATVAALVAFVVGLLAACGTSDPGEPPLPTPAGTLPAQLSPGTSDESDEPPLLIPVGLLLPAQLTPGISEPIPNATLVRFVGSVNFDHPAGEIRWEGPDERVSTLGNHHCGPLPELKRDFGVPAAISVRDAESTTGFFSPSPVLREPDWGWTGYWHDEWQLWQGDTSSTVFLVHADAPELGFAYHNHGCD